MIFHRYLFIYIIYALVCKLYGPNIYQLLFNISIFGMHFRANKKLSVCFVLLEDLQQIEGLGIMTTGLPQNPDCSHWMWSCDTWQGIVGTPFHMPWPGHGPVGAVPGMLHALAASDL